MMNAQRDIRTIIFGTALAGLLIAAMVTPALGQDRGYDARWLPWLGCWEPVEVSPEAEGDAPMLCLRPLSDGAGVEMLTVEDGQIAARQTIQADSRSRQASREGCEGHERTQFSESGHRVYLSSEFVCEGGIERSSAGLMSMISPYEWLDVRSIAVGDEMVPWVFRYQLASREAVRAVGLDGIVADRAMAQQSARLAASADLTIDDIIDASEHVGPRAVEAWVVERGDQFDVDAQALLAMSDAGVPPSVIDMVVAVSNPDHFVVDRGMDEPEFEDDRRAGPSEREWSRRGVYGAGYGRYYDPFYYDPYFLSPFYSPYAGIGLYGSYGYGRGIGYNRGIPGYGYGYGVYRPTVVVVGRREHGDEARSPSRAVRGRGYTRGGGSSSSGSSGVRPKSSSSGGASAAPSKPKAPATKPAGRKAKRRPGG